MAATDSHTPSFEDFRRYHQGRMSHEEQHRLEKRLLEEPLFADAYEGYVAMIENKVDREASLEQLNEALQSRITGDKKRVVPIWAYAAAASVVLSVSWLVYTNKESAKMTSIVSEQIKTSDAPPVVEDLAVAVAPSASSIDSVKAVKKDQIITRSSRDNLRDFADRESKTERIAAVEKSGSVVVANDQVLTEISPATPAREVDAAKSLPAQSRALSAPSSLRSKGSVVEKSEEPKVAQGRIVDAEGHGMPGVNVFKSTDTGVSTDSNGNFQIAAGLRDSLKISSIGYKSKWIKTDRPTLGDITLEDDRQALSEVVVKGNGAQSKKRTVRADGNTYLKASPEGGWKSYEIYLRQKAIDARTGSVKVSFQVNADGSLSDVSAKGDVALREAAINVIKNGPTWLPATKNTLKIPEKVTVTVEFRN
jgi:TonB family protein